jgi:hypothetical protein
MTRRASTCGGPLSYSGSCGTCPRCQPAWYRDGVLIEDDEDEDEPDDLPEEEREEREE